jgi:ABC-2 type transport system permease protein
MRGFSAIARHEMFVLLISPATYVAGFFFLLLMWLIYWLVLKDLPSEDLPASSFFQLFWLPVLFMVPLLTMRSIAEERRMGTLESTLTTPTTPLAVVLGKFAGVYAVYLVFWALALGYPLLAAAQVPEGSANFSFAGGSQLTGGFLFVAVSGTMYIAAGIFASSLTRSQLVAAMLCFAILFMVILGEQLLFTYSGAQAIVPERWQPILDYFRTFRQLEDFSRGIVDTRPFALYFTSAAVLLGIAVVIVERKATR